MPNINITTTHTITCDNAPVEEVYRELDKKFPQLNPLIEQKLKLREERDDARKSNQTLLTLNDALKLKVVELTRERDEWAKSADFLENEFNKKHDELVQARRETELERALKEALVSKNADLTSERDEVQKRLEESCAVKEKLMAENKALAARDDALDGAFETQQMRINRLERKLKEAEDSLAESEPLPKPEDCKAGELYLAKVLGREVVATRCDPEDDDYPWAASSTDEGYSDFYPDEKITLLSRLLPDREVK